MSSAAGILKISGIFAGSVLILLVAVTEPSHTQASSAWEAVADSLIADEDLGGAAAALREAYSLDEGNAAILRKLAAVSLNLGDLAAARQALDLVVEMDRSDVDSYLELARIEWLSGSFDQAMQCVNLAEVASVKPDARIPAYRSIVYRGTGMLAEAESVLVAANEEFPKNPLILSNLGFVEALAGNSEDGFSYALRAYELDSNNAYVIGSLAGLYLAEGNLDEARRLYERALEVDPLNYFTRRSLENFDNIAIEARLQRLMTDGVRYFDKSLYSKARRAFSEAIALDSTLFEAYLNLGFTLNLLGEPRNAIRMFGTAETLDSTSASLYIGWGNALAGIGEYGRAAGAYERALALDSTLVEIREALRTVRELSGSGEDR